MKVEGGEAGLEGPRVKAVRQIQPRTYVMVTVTILVKGLSLPADGRSAVGAWGRGAPNAEMAEKKRHARSVNFMLIDADGITE